MFISANHNKGFQGHKGVSLNDVIGIAHMIFYFSCYRQHATLVGENEVIYT